MTKAQEMNFEIRGQYIRDLSFENPDPHYILKKEEATTPDISCHVETSVHQMGETFYEVVLNIRVDAKDGNKAVFIVELACGALVYLTGADEDAKRALLSVQTPTLLFPFARNIIADVTRDGGYPPLYMSPIDFWRLYEQKLASEAAASEEKATIN